MATTRSAHTIWTGNLLEGRGTVRLDSSGMGEYAVSWPSRSEEPSGATSPEELIAAAHSSCYSMALAHGLTTAGTPPLQLHTTADVTFQPGTGITGIHLTVKATVPGITSDKFMLAAQDAKENCPVSQALTGTTITLDAQLL
ncbi:OsmC family protein [Streptomyces sp. NPDC001675]